MGMHWKTSILDLPAGWQVQFFSQSLKKITRIDRAPKNIMGIITFEVIWKPKSNGALWAREE